MVRGLGRCGPEAAKASETPFSLLQTQVQIMLNLWIITLPNNVTLGKVIEIQNHDQQQIPNSSSSSLRDGFKFYKIPECLFADLILSFQDHKSSQDFFNKRDWKHAYEVIEVELGLVYDKLYTKAVLTYSHRGIFLKFVSFLSTLSAFVIFSCLLYNGHLNNDHQQQQHNTKGDINWNVIITFVLFTGSILLEIYAVIVLLSSNWTMFWLSKRKKNWRVDLLYKFISCCQNCFKLSHAIMWSNRMSQFNLIRFCLKDEPIKCINKIQKFLLIYEYFEKSNYQKTEHVRPELKELIFDLLKEKSKDATKIEACKELCAYKGDQVLKKCSCHVPDIIDWSIKGVDFDQSILLWHIATDLCSYSDSQEPQDLNDAARQSRETSKLLSDYMLSLLVIRPFLLPNGIGQNRFEDTCAEVDELLKERKYIKKSDQVCKMMLRVNTEIPPSEVKGDRSKSVMFDACRLAKSLQRLTTKEENQLCSKEEKWKIISHVWVEMLCHAASRCRGLHHAKQLSHGGEFITHVWLLMAHLGITEQFQISQGHARAKLMLS